jgi:hypothetical protein
MLGGEELRGRVFIHPSSYRPFELEDVSELLNSGTPFFQLELETGEVVIVSIRLEAQPHRARVLDYLNALTSRFLTLYTSNEARLINSSLIDRVRPLD